MQTFTIDKPPKSGKAKKLWDWWIKHRGEPPKELWVNRPGRHQRSAGTCHYGFQLVGNTAYRDDVNNWLISCRGCFDERDEYWEEAWEDYHSMVM